MNPAALHIIRSQHPDYLKVLALRQKVLRAPLGMNLYDEDLSREIDEHIFICKENEEIIGCLLLAPVAVQKGKLRQMAVSADRQGTGIGTALIRFAEEFARSKQYKTFELHARISALPFYEKLGYEAVGTPFTEVGIPHVKMIKQL